MKPTHRRGLLIGYGSIGRHHLKILTRRYSQVGVIDTSHDSLARARADHPGVETFGGLEALASARWPMADTVAVIATWGPSHAALFTELVEAGVRHILVEKPVAHSFAQAHRMMDLARSRRVSWGVHHHLRYSGLANGLRQLCDQYALGAPTGVLVHGGALCLVTNGIHYIDLASELLGSRPSSVMSTARGEAINPRSPDLRYYGGTATWSFPGERETVISFSNRSSVTTSIQVYYRDATIQILGDFSVEIRRRPAADIAKFPAITRHGPASELVYKGPVPGLRPIEDRTSSLLQEIEDARVTTMTPEMAAEALGAVLGALESGRDGRRVDLPLAEKGIAAKTEWPIS